MINTRTKFKVSSLSPSKDIIGKLKLKMDHVTCPWTFLGLLFICRLWLAVFNQSVKFEMPTISCNENMKDNAKYKNYHFEPAFVCVVHFLLVLFEPYSLALTVEALWAHVGRNHGFREGDWSLWTQVSEVRGAGSSTNDCWHQKRGNTQSSCMALLMTIKLFLRLRHY